VLGCLAVFGLVVSPFLAPTPAGADPIVSVNPNCGTADTRFIAGTAGWPKREGGSGVCHYVYSFYVDDQPLPDRTYDDTLSVFLNTEVDLKAELANCCPFFQLSNGEHMLTTIFISSCEGGNTETTICWRSPFTVVASATRGDPWENDQRKSVDGGGRETMWIKFDPAGVCDIPECPTIYLIQVGRFMGRRSGQSNWECLDPSWFFPGRARDSTAYAAAFNDTSCTFVDDVFGFDPYANGGFDRLDRQIGHTGAQGSNPDTASFRDTPHVDSPLEFDSLRVFFEVNALCGDGASAGTFLGRTFWIYERSGSAPLGMVGRDPSKSPDREQPSEDFKAALRQYPRYRSGFVLPFHEPPEKKAGFPCS